MELPLLSSSPIDTLFLHTEKHRLFSCISSLFSRPDTQSQNRDGENQVFYLPLLVRTPSPTQSSVQLRPSSHPSPLDSFTLDNSHNSRSLQSLKLQHCPSFEFLQFTSSFNFTSYLLTSVPTPQKCLVPNHPQSYLRLHRLIPIEIYLTSSFNIRTGR